MKPDGRSMNTFDAQMERIKLITGKRTQVELADFLGIRQSSISDAKRREKIPSGWLVILIRVKNVHPEWILTGTGPCFMMLPPSQGCYETGDAVAARRADEEAFAFTYAGGRVGTTNRGLAGECALFEKRGVTVQFFLQTMQPLGAVII